MKFASEAGAMEVLDLFAEMVAKKLLPRIEAAMERPKTSPLERFGGYMTKAEVAEFFRVDARTVHRWTRKGLLPNPTRAGKEAAYPIEAVERLRTTLTKYQQHDSRTTRQ